MEALAGAPVTLTLITLNVFVALYQNFEDPSIIEKFSFKPRHIIDRKEYYRLFTSGFVHGGFMHLAFNMITLYFFGPVLERDILGSAGFMGPRAEWGWLFFIALYFGSEMVAHVATMSQRKNDPYYSSVGASGAVSGVVVAYCLYAPFSLLYLFFVIPIPAILFAVGYIWFSFYAMKKAQQGQPVSGMERIAHEAHLGGAIGGLLLIILIHPQSVRIFLDNITRFF